MVRQHQTRNDEGRTPPHPRGMFCPSYAGIVSLENRGRRKSRMLHRTRSLACESKKHTSKSPQVRRNAPAFPARLVLTASFALSLVIGLFVTIPAQCEALSRVHASVEASRPHDFAVRLLAHSS